MARYLGSNRDSRGLGKLLSLDLGMYLFVYSGINKSTAGFESHSPRALNKHFSSFASGGFTTGDRTFKLEEEEAEAQAEEFAASSIFLFLNFSRGKVYVLHW